MKLCDDHHEEICYEARYCPMCEKASETDRLEREAEDLRDEIRILKDDLRKATEPK